MQGSGERRRRRRANGVMHACMHTSDDNAVETDVIDEQSSSTSPPSVVLPCSTVASCEFEIAGHVTTTDPSSVALVNVELDANLQP